MPAIRLSGLSPFGPIFVKELRSMSRRTRTYIVRTAYLGLLVAVLMIFWFAEGQNLTGGATALTRLQQQNDVAQVFFGTFLVISLGTMMLLSPILTATTISGERLARTLPILLSTPMSAWQIIGGKLFSRLLTAYSLLLLAMPVLAIVRLLGSVELRQIVGTIAITMAVGLSGAALGLLLSTFRIRSYAAIFYVYLLYFMAYGLLPLGLMAMNRQWSGTLELLHPLVAVAVLMQDPFNADWWPAATLQVAIGAVVTVLAALSLRRVARIELGDLGAVVNVEPPPMAQVVGTPTAPNATGTDAGGDSALSDAATVDTGNVTTAAPLLTYSKLRDAGRPVSDRPILWREMRINRRMRGWARGLYYGIAVAVLGGIYASVGRDWRFEMSHIVALCIGTALWTLAMIVYAATAIATEKEGDTWTLLLTTPLRGYDIVMGKAVGLLWRLRLPVLLLALHLVIFTIGGVLGVLAATVTLCVILTFTLPWLAFGVYLSLRMKRVTMALATNLGFALAYYAGIPMLLSVFYDARVGGKHLFDAFLVVLPYSHIALSIDRFTPGRDYNSIRFNGLDFTVDGYVLLVTMLCITHVAVAVLILSWAAARFDAIVGRAPQKG